jgi:hypothetical protein
VRPAIVGRWTLPIGSSSALLFGLALALVEMSGWKMNYLRHGIGIAGVLLAGTCVILLFGFSGATLRSPVSLRWPVLLPSDKPSAALVPIVRPQPSKTATPTPINSAELMNLRNENIKLKIENGRLRKGKPARIASALPIPSPCVSVTPTVITSPKMNMGDCVELMGEQQLLDSANQELHELSKNYGTAEGQEKYNAALYRQAQAAANVANLANRLCQ